MKKKEKCMYFLLINISIVCPMRADLVSLLKNSAQSKEVWIGAAVATTAWGVHKLYADRFSKSLQEEIYFEDKEFGDLKPTTEDVVKFYFSPSMRPNFKSSYFENILGSVEFLT